MNNIWIRSRGPDLAERRTHATGQTYPRFSREALDGEGVCCNCVRPKIGVGMGLTVNQRGISK